MVSAVSNVLWELSSVDDLCSEIEDEQIDIIVKAFLRLGLLERTVEHLVEVRRHFAEGSLV
jgi:hypothetical protein